jgi:hypothetical protein
MALAEALGIEGLDEKMFAGPQIFLKPQNFTSDPNLSPDGLLFQDFRGSQELIKILC